MAVTHSIIQLNSGTPIAISVTGNHAGRDITIQNLSDTEYVYLGGETVDVEDFGYRIAPNSAWSVELRQKEVIYALSSTNSAVAVLQLGLESMSN